MWGTRKVSEKRHKILKKVLVTRFRILWELYLDKTYSQTQLADRSETDQGNLSKYINELMEDGLVEVTEEYLGVGRPAKLISLSSKARDILKHNMPFFLEEEVDKELEPLHAVRLIKLLSSKETRSLAADRLELVSRDYVANCESTLYPTIACYLQEEGYRDIAHTLLKSLHNFIQKLDDASMNKVSQILGKTLRKIYEAEDESDKGRRIKRFISEIFDELDIHPASYEELKGEYVEAVLNKSSSESQVLIDRIQRFFPEENLDLELSLVERFESADEKQKHRIEAELSRLR